MTKKYTCSYVLQLCVDENHGKGAEKRKGELSPDDLSLQQQQNCHWAFDNHQVIWKTYIKIYNGCIR